MATAAVSDAVGVSGGVGGGVGGVGGGAGGGGAGAGAGASAGAGAGGGTTKVTKVTAVAAKRAGRTGGVKRKIAAPATVAKKGDEEVPLKRTRKVVTWDVRTAIIYAFLHPQIYDSDRSRITTCAKVIGVKRQTVHGWLNTDKINPHVGRWFDTVRELTWRNVRKRLGKAFGEKFDTIDPDSKVRACHAVPCV
jgi:hypothetical protein